MQRVLRPDRGAPTGSGPVYVRGDGEPGDDRGVHRLGPGATLDLDTYAGGFPARGWHELTGRRQARFSARLAGHGSLRLYAVGPAGERHLLDEWEVAGTPVTCEALLRLDGPHEWVWAEVAAASHAGMSAFALTYAVEGPVQPVGLGVAITTLDRPELCLAVLTALSRVDPAVLRRVVVVDHGRSPLTGSARFAEVAGRLGTRLSVVTEPNLGGSGGFSRGMAELLDLRAEGTDGTNGTDGTGGPQGGDGGVTHVLLLDDDIVLDPEVVERAAAAAALGHDGLLGAHMLYSSAPTVLHSTGEVIEPSSFIWRTPPDGATLVDLASRRPSTSPALRRSHVVDYSGWWMCLVPADVLRASGLSMPFFIKWDDVELGLRARELGRPTRTLPGVGVWHVPWADKDTAVDWQVFYLTRNRLVTAALHGQCLPLRLVAGVAARAAEHAVTMAYGAADLALEGLVAFRAGPAALAAEQSRGLAPVRERQDRFTRTSLRKRVRVEPARGRVAAGESGPPPRSGLAGALLRAFVWAPPRRHTALVPLGDADVGRLGALDRATIVSPTGDPHPPRVRDRRLARRQLAAVGAEAVRVLVGWRRLRRQYRREARSLTSPQAWRDVLDRA